MESEGGDTGSYREAEVLTHRPDSACATDVLHREPPDADAVDRLRFHFVRRAQADDVHGVARLNSGARLPLTARFTWCISRVDDHANVRTVKSILGSKPLHRIWIVEDHIPRNVAPGGWPGRRSQRQHFALPQTLLCRRFIVREL